MEQTKTVNVPRVMLAAASSGSGKTLLTCGLLDVLLRRELRTGAFKCGPDYIDPMFHREVLGIESGNLDPFFCDAAELMRILGSEAGTYTVIEGVMGIYDGMSAEDRRASCYDTAAMTDTPIILLVNASGVGRTVISMIRGILADDDRRLIRGLILNCISPGFYEKLRPCLEKELAESGFDGVRILGGVPRIRDTELESRHLGLKMPAEISGIREKLRRLGDEIEKSCDVDGILQIMESAEKIPLNDRSEQTPAIVTGAGRPVVAVARDEAFCFFYRENLRLLEQVGAVISFFSPIRDKALPDGAAGLLLGGGYPELHLKELSENTSMLDSISSALKSGIPSIAECGGYMYLHRSVRDRQGACYPLVGAVDGECYDTGHLVRFGYLRIAETDVPGNSAFNTALAGMKGHEFHYYDSTAAADSCLAEKPVTGEKWRCMICDERRMWGYPHFYYGSHSELPRAFVRAAMEYANG